MKKVLFIFALIVSLVLPGVGSVAYAMDYPSNIPEPPVDSSYKVILYKADSIIYLFTINQSQLDVYLNDGYLNIKYWDSEKNTLLLCNDYPSTRLNGFNVSNYQLQNSEWKPITSSNRDILANSSYEIFSTVLDIEFIYSDINIIDFDTREVVFPLPPGPLGMPEGTITEIVTQVNPLKEILILLPMVIPCLVGFVSLRKALRILVTILKTA